MGAGSQSEEYSWNPGQNCDQEYRRHPQNRENESEGQLQRKKVIPVGYVMNVQLLYERVWDAGTIVFEGSFCRIM